jgi:hypothetical protein
MGKSKILCCSTILLIAAFLSGASAAYRGKHSHLNEPASVKEYYQATYEERNRQVDLQLKTVFSVVKSESEDEELDYKKIWTCQGCKVASFAVNKILSLYWTTYVFEYISSEYICPAIIESKALVCHGIVKLMGDSLVDAITTSLLTPDYICE